ncbi:MAG: tetratricopeptide repeat protein [Alphaproteobacteria bacterium]|nr:tetratricopeptide repeat protein [Alphaproteobacteria bacterium]MBV9863120.1 tetratricopeptide repeat protein [Alphaproteobacteria bacterium]
MPLDCSAILADACRREQEGGWFEAAALCRQLLADEPHNAAAHHLLGVIALRLGNADSAIDCLRRSLAGDAVPAAYHDDLGCAYFAAHRLEEAAASHRRALELDPECAAAHNNLGKTLRAQGLPAEACSCFRRALALVPDCADAHYNLGNALAALGDKAGAAERFRAALALRPDFADAHVNLGLMLFDAGDYAEAANCYCRALALDPGHAIAHNNLGNVQARRGDLIAATESLERAIRLGPGYIAPRINLGNVILERGAPETALACYESALRLAPDHVEAHQNLGLVRLLLGDFAGGWPEWRWPRPVPPRFVQPEWRGEPLGGAAILLHAEQGFGDILHFVRYVPLVAARGGRVILEVPPELLCLLGGIEGAERVIACGEPLPDFAWHCSLLSLPLAFGTELSTIPARVPYIETPAPSGRILPPAPDRLRVGLVWAGRPQHNRDRYRSLPLAALAPLGRVDGVSFHSLQKGEAAQQIAQHGPALRLDDLGDRLHDFTDTAAAIAGLDLVISVDTAVAHLAGALGKPVWLMLSWIPDWRWLMDREDSPWYPTARLFRQPAYGDWDGVVEQVGQALANLALR